MIKDMLSSCNLCIRKCNINRNLDKFGYCNSTKDLIVAKAFLHLWEEPCISGKNGSGTVFFSNCNLKCVFCQNHVISHDGTGKKITPKRLSEIFLELQNKGANNINLVTPTHFVPQIIEALDLAKVNGLNIPVLYNTNSYDSLETIKSLKGYIDVYLPDFKYFDDKYAIKYSKAPGYAENTISIIKEMLSQVGTAKFNKDGIIEKGVIIRHLLLPGLLFDSKKVIDTIYNTFHDDVFISLMNQYIPMYKACTYPEINKPLNPKTYDSIINYALNLGVKNGFIQEEGTNSLSYVPSFDYEGV